MKIRFVASMSRYAGGTTTYTDNLATALRGLGEEVVIQSDRNDLTEFGRRPYVEPVWTRDLRYPLQNLRAARRGAKEEVIHVHHEFYLFGGPSTALAFPALLAGLRLLDRPVVTTLHGVLSRATAKDSRVVHGSALPPSLSRAVVTRLQRQIVIGSDAVVVHDDFFRDVLVNECGAPRDRIHVIPHGVRADLTRSDRTEARDRLGIPATTILLLYFGYLARYKGLETLLDAFNLVAPDRPKVELAIAGGPPARNTEDGEAYRRSLEERIAPALRDRVRFTGHVPEGQVADWFSAADLVALAHAVPLAASGVLALAQGYGAALVAPAIPPFLRSVHRPEALYEAGSSTELSQKIGRLVDDPALLRSHGAASRDDGRLASWPSVARQHRELYRALLGARGRRGKAASAASAQS